MKAKDYVKKELMSIVSQCRQIKEYVESGREYDSDIVQKDINNMSRRFVINRIYKYDDREMLYKEEVNVTPSCARSHAQYDDYDGYFNFSTQATANNESEFFNIEVKAPHNSYHNIANMREHAIYRIQLYKGELVGNQIMILPENNNATIQNVQYIFNDGELTNCITVMNISKYIEKLTNNFMVHGIINRTIHSKEPFIIAGMPTLDTHSDIEYDDQNIDTNCDTNTGESNLKVEIHNGIPRTMSLKTIELGSIVRRQFDDEGNTTNIYTRSVIDRKTGSYCTNTMTQSHAVMDRKEVRKNGFIVYTRHIIDYDNRVKNIDAVDQHDRRTSVIKESIVKTLIDNDKNASSIYYMFDSSLEEIIQLCCDNVQATIMTNLDVKWKYNDNKGKPVSTKDMNLLISDTHNMVCSNGASYQGIPDKDSGVDIFNILNESIPIEFPACSIHAVKIDNLRFNAMVTERCDDSISYVVWEKDRVYTYKDIVVTELETFKTMVDDANKGDE